MTLSLCSTLFRVFSLSFSLTLCVSLSADGHVGSSEMCCHLRAEADSFIRTSSLINLSAFLFSQITSNFLFLSGDNSPAFFVALTNQNSQKQARKHCSSTFYSLPMAEANQCKRDETNLCMQDKNQPTEGLVSNKNSKETQFSDPNALKKLENLNLMLSLGGIYSENAKEKPLARSSSIAGVMTLEKNSNEPDVQRPNNFLSLERSCSLPVEVMALKDLHREVKKQAAEQQTVGKGGNGEKEAQDPEGEPFPGKLQSWATTTAATNPALYRALLKIKALAVSARNKMGEGSGATCAAKGGACSHESPHKLETVKSVFPSASIAAKGVAEASGLKETTPELNFQTKALGKQVRSAETEQEKPSKKAKVGGNSLQDDGMAVMKQMPTVITIGDGPNGRKVEGFLYRYTKGQVSIVCVCHGSFLSPAEFVRHAGAKDDSDPMKRISVFPTSLY